MKILVVDDSAYNRQVITEILASLDFVTEVNSAVDGVDAFNQAARTTPDLILLDLEMPKMDGFTFLRLLRNRCSTPVIVLSGLSYNPDGEKAVRLGANTFIGKPTKVSSNKLYSVKDELVKSIRAIANGLPEKATAASCSVNGSCVPVSTESTGVEAIVIGASTGGPKAVSKIVSMLPLQLSFAVVVTLHIPSWVTLSFIERLRRELGADSSIEVHKARHMEPVKSGSITVAPGGYHIGFKRSGAGTVLTTLERGKQGEGCAPSIDRMFSSAASVWGNSLVGVIMTGMGSDGQKGVVEIKRSGGYVIAESRQSSIIFSMPSSAISTGRVDRVLSCNEIGAWIYNRRTVAARL